MQLNVQKHILVLNGVFVAHHDLKTNIIIIHHTIVDFYLNLFLTHQIFQELFKCIYQNLIYTTRLKIKNYKMLYALRFADKSLEKVTRRYGPNSCKLEKMYKIYYKYCIHICIANIYLMWSLTQCILMQYSHKTLQ